MATTPTNERRLIPIGFRVSAALKEQLDKACATEERSIAAFVERVLRAHFENQNKRKK